MSTYTKSTATLMRPTWVQMRISPLATRVSSIFFQNRKAIAMGIRSVAKGLGHKENLILRIILGRHGILLPKFRGIRLEQAEHCHFRKNVTTTKLTLAAHEFYRMTGRDDFVMVIPAIVRGKASERLQYSSREGIDYKRILSAIKPRVLKELQKEAPEAEEWRSEVIDQAFDLASRVSRTEQAELIYRIQKMADIGGDIQAVVASLFMDMSPEKIENLLNDSRSEGLVKLSCSIKKIVQRYQYLKDHFGFDPSQIAKDKKYIYRKMTELIRGARMPRTLLLVFLDKLTQARKAQAREGRERPPQIFHEIRFFYAPLAERLGLVFLADDFRDQFLRLGNPVKYKFIVEKVRGRIRMDYEGAKIFLSMYARELFALLQEKLKAESQEITVKFRVKSPYSIWNKVEIRGEYSYDALNDILGIKIICESEAQLMKIRDIVKKNDLFMVKSGGIKEVLKKPEIERTEEEGVKWRGIKMVGEDAQGVPIEIQIMTQEMNNENNRGKAATWRYNLEKELGEIEQVFDILEPKEVITSSFVDNFYQLLNYWTVPVEKIK